MIGANLTRHLQVKQILPILTERCPIISRTNSTIVSPVHQKSVNDFFLPLYSISMMWYAFNGVMLTVVLGWVASLLCGNSKAEMEKIDRSLLISFSTSKKNNSEINRELVAVMLFILYFDFMQNVFIPRNREKIH